MVDFADVIVDLQAGDTGKGKVAHHLASGKNGTNYTHVVRYNGGGNAGHTIYHNGEKIVTHFIPIGFTYKIKSVIGPGCVVNINELLKEIEYLENKGLNVREFLKIDKRVHIITDKHLQEETSESKIGTTKKGNGPAYRDKYSRKGIRAQEIVELKEFIIDVYDEFHSGNEKNVKILFEGAQGFELDIDWGDYPYVTSSHCTVGSACLNGVSPKDIREVYGIAKVYRTYVGAKQFEGSDIEFSTIRELGNEYGATTGRPRQINWLDLDMLEKSIRINGVTKLIINKLDILEKLNIFKFYHRKELIICSSSENFQQEILNRLEKFRLSIDFSKTPMAI